MHRWKMWWARLGPYAVPSLVYMAVCLVMFWHLWTPVPGGQRTFGWDAIWEYWGDLEFQVDAVRDRELPLWNPYDRTGYPFHADPQAGLLYPPTWLLVGVALALGATPWWLMAIKILFHFWLAGVGTYAYLRRRNNHPAACYAGGLALILSYPFIHNEFSALNWSFAWAPLMLLAIDAWSERPSAVRAILLALTTALAFLAGAMGSFWYALLIAVPYGIWAVIHQYRSLRGQEGASTYLKTAAVTLLAAGAIFVVLIAAQALATSMLLGESVRAERDLGFFGFSVLRARDMIGFFVPRMPGENTYLGFAAILWIAAALTIEPTGRRLLFAGVAVFAVLCAWGDRGMALPVSGSLLEPFTFFRRAHRYLYVSSLPLAILAAEGLHCLITTQGDERRRRLARFALCACGLAVAIFGTAYAIRVMPGDKQDPLVEALGLGAVAALLGTWTTITVIRWPSRTLFIYVAAAALGVDLWFARIEVINRNMHPVPEISRDRELKEIAGTTLDYRIYDIAYIKYRPGLRKQIRDFGGYEEDPLSLRRYANFLLAIREAPRHLGHANVRVFFSEGRTKIRSTSADGNHVKPMSKAGSKGTRAGVSEVSPAAPAVMWVGRATVVSDENAARAALFKTVPGTAAVLERSNGPDGKPDDELARLQIGSETPPVPGRLAMLSRNRLEAVITAPAAGVVVIHEAYFPRGWTATVDGQPARILPANALFRGIVVGSGKHTIVMEYSAPGYLWLVALQLLTLVGIAAFLLWSWARGRQRHAPAASPGQPEPALTAK